ncbi:MAG: cell division site-positioning protein MapZ family protein [Vagococcus sp.]|uniref:cell division site-positioning protein MapZ family protein n=1 Tax=Vagococcus TaxID=2737 RepID=UPI002FCC5438
MTNKVNKCPNCGHQFKDGEEFCPNCDLFIPVSEQEENNFDPNQTKQFKTFKEIEEKEKANNQTESRFKHRTKKVDDETDELTEKNETVTEEKVGNSEVDSLPQLPIEKVIEKTEASVDMSEEDNNENLTFEETAFVEEISTTEDNSDTTYETVLEETIDKVVLSPIVENEETIPSQSTQENKSNKKKKAIIGLAAATVLAIGGGTFYSNQQKEAAKKAETELVKTTESNLASLFTSEDQVFLKEGITSEDIEKAKNEVTKLKTSSNYDQLEKIVNEAEIKFGKQESVNTLFKSPIMTGKSLASDVFVKDDSALGLTPIEEEKDGFDILFNKALAEAKAQKEILQQVSEKMALVFKDNEVVKNASRDDYKAAEKLVNELKDQEAKEEYNKQLKEVDTFLVKADEKKKEQEALAAQAEQERLAKLAPETTPEPIINNNNNTANNGQLTGPGGNYRWGNREDAVIDYNDAAWAWAPGVQEKVISEVISRGYVVEGGYTLVPKYVENGEGFYDLYATTNSKIFPKSKPEEFPLYVVTINAKTGWFKGNGPN